MPKAYIFKALALGAASFVFCFLAVASYLFTDGFRDYPNYCSKFIPHIEQIKLAKGTYPENLDQIKNVKNSLRYKRKECSYSSRNGEYELITKHGFIGIAGYQSKTKKWFYD